MNLKNADLPPEAIEALRKLNVRDVETLLSMLAVPTGEAGIAKVLGLSLEAVRKLGSRLHAQFPDVVVDPVSGSFYPMGHRTCRLARVADCVKALAPFGTPAFEFLPRLFNRDWMSSAQTLRRTSRVSSRPRRWARAEEDCSCPRSFVPASRARTACRTTAG